MINCSRLMKFALSALLAGVAADASAVAQRTFVASFGSDSSPSCSLAAPCRGFAAAIAQTQSGGEVIVIDSAGYGAFTISQAVSIIAPPGVYAGISVFSGNGITITAGTGKVTLRGLTINGLGGVNGILVNSAGTVYIDRLTISGFATGLVVGATASTTINIQQSAFRDNANGGTFTTTSGTVSVAVDSTAFERNNTAGLSFGASSVGAIVASLFAGGGAGVNAVPASGTAKVEIRDSTISDNIGTGAFGGGTGGTISVVSSVISGNNIGLQANGANTEVYASDSTITRNALGVQGLNGGVARTSTDNRLVNNTTNGSFNQTTPKS
jgi:hypothetical protein